MSKYADLPNLTQKQRWYAAHLDEAEQQGLNIAAYAKKHGLRVKNVYNARSKLKQLGGTVESKLIHAGTVSNKVSSKARVLLPNGCAIDIHLCDTSLSALLKQVSAL